MTSLVENQTENTAVAPCPVCGSYANSTLAERSALLAVCDVLVLRALEVVGNRIVRAPGERRRYKSIGDRPRYMAHTLWSPDEKMINSGLERAWEVIPALLSSHGSCGMTSAQVTNVLDEYTRGLLQGGVPHSIIRLRGRFRQGLGLELPMMAGNHSYE